MIRRITRLADTPLLFLAGLYVLAPMAIDALRSVRRRGGYRANLRVVEDPRVVEELAAELSKYEEFGDGPFVCPGCYAVGEPCKPGCVDDEIRRERENTADREDDDRDSGWEAAS